MPNFSGIWTVTQQMQAVGQSIWPAVPGAPTIGTATATGSTTATVAFTAPANLGYPATVTYTATSSPGGLTATGTSPITVTGLTGGTSYTFTVTATNATGTGPASAASNSITTLYTIGQALGGGFYAGQISTAGNSIADKIAKMFPNKVYRVDHSKFKDANDFLQNNAATEFKGAWWNCKKYTPENVLNTTDQFLSLYRDTPEHQYVPTGIQALDDKIMGLMQGHFTVIKAPTGIGKTEVMRYLEYNMLQRGIPIATWHLEETKLRTLLGLVSYELQDNLTRRDLIEEKQAEDLVIEAIKRLTKDELLYQFYLSDGQGADDLIDQIRFFSQAAGCKFVFFEPIQDVVAGLSEESKEQMLADLSVRLSKLAAELNVGIVTIAHTNDNGDPKYCKMIGQRASVIIDLHRDKEASSLEERNTTYIRVEKNRPCSEEGNAGMLRFNTETFTLREV